MATRAKTLSLFILQWKNVRNVANWLQHLCRVCAASLRMESKQQQQKTEAMAESIRCCCWYWKPHKVLMTNKWHQRLVTEHQCSRTNRNKSLYTSSLLLLFQELFFQLFNVILQFGIFHQEFLLFSDTGLRSCNETTWCYCSAPQQQLFKRSHFAINTSLKDLLGLQEFWIIQLALQSVFTGLMLPGETAVELWNNNCSGDTVWKPPHDKHVLLKKWRLLLAFSFSSWTCCFRYSMSWSASAARCSSLTRGLGLDIFKRERARNLKHNKRQRDIKAR